MPAKTIARKVLTTTFLLTILSISLLNLRVYNASQKVLGATTTNTLSESQVTDLTTQLNYWLSVVKQFPTYRDGFLIIAEIQNQLGATSEALNALNTAKQIDPNSDKVLLTEKNLNL